jgi:nucleotide-binding universal stress UspA family protein
MGSVTEKVMLKATCPVLTVPRAVDGRAQAPVFRRIVCGTDFSEASLRGLKFALSFCAEAGGHLTLLHAVEWMPEASLPGLPQFDLRQFGASLVSEAQARLEQLVPAETRDWCEIKATVRVGKPYVEMRTAA